MSENKSLPLSGVKVVELGTYVAVPSAARMLAEYGAEVIKVEPPNGDSWRVDCVSQQVTIGDYNAPLFAVQNSGKKFISLNTQTEAGREALFKLLAEADVFVTNVRMKSLQKVGLDYESLKDKFPKLVYYHFSGFGPVGPDAPRPGFDVAAFWARSGAMADWVTEGDFPIRSSTAFGDLACGSLILNGILMALINQRATGKGTYAHSSLMSSSLWYNSTGVIASQEPYGKKYPEDPLRPGNPFFSPYRCQDGEWIFLAAIGNYEKNRGRIAELLGLSEVFADERAASLISLRETDYIAEVVTRMNEAFLTKTADEWCEICRQNDLVYEKLRHYREVATDPQALANNYLAEVEFKSGNKTRMPAAPITFPELGRLGTQNVGGVGENTDEILAAVGYTPEQIAALRESKDVK